MPGKDGTGPMGAGAMTGRGMGPCGGTNAAMYGVGLGFGCRRGFGRGFGRFMPINQAIAKPQKEMLQEQKDVLKSRLDLIDQQIEKL